MKNCTFYVPQKHVDVVSVIATDHEEAKEKLLRGEDVQHLYSIPGSTASGEIELISCVDIMSRKVKGEKNEQQ